MCAPDSWANVFRGPSFATWVCVYLDDFLNKASASVRKAKKRTQNSRNVIQRKKKYKPDNRKIPYVGVAQKKAGNSHGKRGGASRERG